MKWQKLGTRGVVAQIVAAFDERERGRGREPGPRIAGGAEGHADVGGDEVDALDLLRVLGTLARLRHRTAMA